MKVSEKQIAEWAENQTTIELLNAVKVRLKELLETPTANCIHYGDPTKSHEALIGQDMKAFMFAVFCEALEGDWSYFEEIEDDD